MYNLRILVNSRPIKKYCDDNGNAWVEARDGTEFTLKVQNSDWRRVLAVVSVDGLNVIDGKHESSQTARGYIIPANGSVSIPGWRISQKKVRQFLFTPKGNSYSQKLGADPENVGVIAAAIFTEKQPIHTVYYSDYYPNGTPDTTAVYNCDIGSNNTMGWFESKCDTSKLKRTSLGYSGQSVNLSDEVEQLGVGSGRHRTHRTHKVSFDRDAQVATIVIYYDTRIGLERRGIYIENYKHHLPRPFPNGDNSYCPDV